MKIIVFGATGRIGNHIVKEALERGHFVRAFARRIMHGNGHGDQLEIFSGDVLDKAVVKKAIQGMDAVVSALGQGRLSKQVDLMSSGTENIVQSMRESGVARILAIGGSGILQADPNTLVRDLPDFPPFLRNVSADHLRVYHLLRESGLEWTLVCPPFIQKERKTGHYNTREDYAPEGKPQITAGDLADFVLNELETPEFTGARVGIRRR
jgi:putative NADH-flavin reductase